MIEISAEGDGDARTIEVGTRNASVPKILPVLPLRESVPLPDTLTPLAIGQERSIELINDVLAGDRLLVMVASKNPDLETPGPADLHDVGVVGSVARMLKIPDGTLRILVQGAQRVRITDWTTETPYLKAVSQLFGDLAHDGLANDEEQLFHHVVRGGTGHALDVENRLIVKAHLRCPPSSMMGDGLLMSRPSRGTC